MSVDTYAHLSYIELEMSVGAKETFKNIKIHIIPY
jgi:hypothetical protein